MIKITDIDGKTWWVNPDTVSAVTTCDEFGRLNALDERVKIRSYIYVGALENVIRSAATPESLLEMFEKHHEDRLIRGLR